MSHSINFHVRIQKRVGKIVIEYLSLEVEAGSRYFAFPVKKIPSRRYFQIPFFILSRGGFRIDRFIHSKNAIRKLLENYKIPVKAKIEVRTNLTLKTKLSRLDKLLDKIHDQSATLKGTFVGLRLMDMRKLK